MEPPRPAIERKPIQARVPGLYVDERLGTLELEFEVFERHLKADPAPDVQPENAERPFRASRSREHREWS
jgi:hypothetical protein